MMSSKIAPLTRTLTKNILWPAVESQNHYGVFSVPILLRSSVFQHQTQETQTNQRTVSTSNYRTNSTETQTEDNETLENTADKFQQNDENVWDNPWKFAHGEPPPPENFTKVVEAPKEDWKWVKRLLPMETIPELPKHDSYPTPSGWFPPSPKADLPYYIRRENDHTFPLSLECRRDQLNLETMEFDYVELVVMRFVHGDIFACESDLKAFLEKRLNRKVATHVNEPQGKIRVKGADRTDLEAFFKECGF